MFYVFWKDHGHGVLAIDFDNSISFNSLLIRGVKDTVSPSLRENSPDNR